MADYKFKKGDVILYSRKEIMVIQGVGDYVIKGYPPKRIYWVIDPNQIDKTRPNSLAGALMAFEDEIAYAGQLGQLIYG